MNKEQFLKENLREGEVYAGLILGRKGASDYHLVLLQGRATDLTWEEAKSWAESLGGSLPTRRDFTVLYSALKPNFDRDGWYWSDERQDVRPNCAWAQAFCDGSQAGCHKSNEFHACAVRRIHLEN